MLWSVKLKGWVPISATLNLSKAHIINYQSGKTILFQRTICIFHQKHNPKILKAQKEESLLQIYSEHNGNIGIIQPTVHLGYFHSLGFKILQTQNRLSVSAKNFYGHIKYLGTSGTLRLKNPICIIVSVIYRFCEDS